MSSKALMGMAAALSAPVGGVVVVARASFQVRSSAPKRAYARYGEGNASAPQPPGSRVSRCLQPTGKRPAGSGQSQSKWVKPVGEISTGSQAAGFRSATTRYAFLRNPWSNWVKPFTPSRKAPRNVMESQISNPQHQSSPAPSRSLMTDNCPGITPTPAPQALGMVNSRQFKPDKGKSRQNVFSTAMKSASHPNTTKRTDIAARRR